MKKAVLCSLALCLALAGAPLSTAAEAPDAEVAELTATATRLGYPAPPAHLSEEGKVVVSWLFTIADAVQQCKNSSLSEEEKRDILLQAGAMIVRGSGMEYGYSELSLLEKQLPDKKLKGKRKWFAIRDFLMEKAKDNPAILVSLYALIRQNLAEVPAEMKTDEFMLGLIEQSAATGDITACQLAAYFHIWGFYGAKVDAKAAVDNLLPMEHHYLRRSGYGFQHAMEYTAMLCREGRELLPLRICALSMAKRFYGLEHNDIPEQTIRAQGIALADLSKQGGNLGKFSAICPFTSVLCEFTSEPPEFWMIAADMLESKGGSAEGVASLRQTAIQHGADPKRDLTPTTPTVNVYSGVYFLPQYITEEESSYICGVLADIDSEPVFAEGLLDLGGIFGEAASVKSDQDFFAYKKKMYSSEKDIGKRFYLLYRLYKDGVGPSHYGRDEDEAAMHLEMACNMDYPLALYRDIQNRLMQNPEPTEEMISTLLQLKLPQGFQLLHKMVGSLPEELQAVMRLDEEIPGVTDKVQLLALEYGDADAWLEWADVDAAKEGDLDAQVLALSFMAGADNCTAEGYLQLEETLAKYAEAHPETADIVKLLRIAALELSLSATCEAKYAETPRPYFQRRYPDATETSTRTEAAKRLENLVKDDMAPAAFQELRRRLQIDIENTKDD